MNIQGYSMAPAVQELALARWDFGWVHPWMLCAPVPWAAAHSLLG